MLSVFQRQSGMTPNWLILTVRKSEEEELKPQENKNVQLRESHSI